MKGYRKFQMNMNGQPYFAEALVAFVRAGITRQRIGLGLRLLAVAVLWSGFAAAGKAAQVTASAPANQWKATVRGGEAKRLLDEGNARFARGDVAGAVEPWTQADGLFAQAHDHRGRVTVLARLCAAYLALGNRRLANTASRDCLEAATASGDRTALVSAECARGAALQSWDPAKAIAALDHALELAQGNPKAEAAILNNRGNLRAQAGQHGAAITDFRRSAELSKAQPAAAAQALLNAALIANQERDWSQGKQFLAAGLQHAEPLSEGLAAPLWIQAAHIAAGIKKSGDTRAAGQAEALLARAGTAAEKLGDFRTASLAVGEHGHLQELAGRVGAALSESEKAAFLAQRAGAPELLYRWEWQIARLCKQTGDADAALAAYRRAVRTLESATLRHDIALAANLRHGTSGFRQSVGPLFYELADILLQSSAKLASGEARQVRLVEARNAVELLKSAELDDYFQDPCQTVARKKIRDIDSISPKTAVIYPISLPDRLEQLVSLPGGIMERVIVPVGAVELDKAAKELQDKLRTRTTYEFVGLSRKMHAWLMKDLGPKLDAAGIETLVFVPDGPLRMIPMGALYDGEKFLAEKYAVAATPGLTLMDPQASAWVTPNLLLNGLSEERMGFPALPSVGAEIRDVRAAFGGVVLTNQQFTVAGVRDEFSRAQFSIVHLATHGHFERDASKSFVLTYDGELSLDGLESLIRPSQFRGQPVELLTLSACQTAAGDDRAALGLAGVAIKAGARSALATLWCVHDEASAALVTSFYAEIRKHPNLSKARALQQAQQQLMNNPNYRHPYYWSAFLIIGNWL